MMELAKGIAFPSAEDFNLVPEWMRKNTRRCGTRLRSGKKAFRERAAM